MAFVQRLKRASSFGRGHDEGYSNAMGIYQILFFTVGSQHFYSTAQHSAPGHFTSIRILLKNPYHEAYYSFVFFLEKNVLGSSQ